MRRTLVALWFADIAGYSEHAAKDETSALRMVEILQTLSRETVTRYNGRVVKFLGDRGQVRVGVHLGDVAVAPDGDLYGDAVNAAARIQQAAAPGQVVVSQDIWRQLRGRRDFCFKPLGDRSL